MFAFADDPARQRQWISFADSISAELPSFADVIEDLAAFLMPRAAAARSFEEAVE